MGERLTDHNNNVGIEAEDVGASLVKVAFTRFEGGSPIHVEMTLSKRATREGFKEFIQSLVDNEDVYMDLIDEYCGKPSFNPDAPVLTIVRPPAPKTQIVSAPRGLRERVLNVCPRCGSTTKDQICQNYGCEHK